jgi:sterol 3beta-glucosyltransferase
MTNISVVASGSRGDVQPYIALAKGLKDAGYNVRLVASHNFEQLANEAGLTFCSSGIGAEEIIQSEEWRKVIEGGNFLKILMKMQSEAKKHASHLATIMPSLLEGSDLIVTGAGGIGGLYPIADLHKIPVVQAYVFPFTPTQEFSSPLVPRLPFGKVLNPLSHRLTRQMLWQSSRVVDTATRQTLGLPKGSFWGPFKMLNQRPEPVMYGYSRHVLPRPNDWAKNVHVTGYWFLDEPDRWTPPSDLMTFLNNGTPPVYIGFGSMGSRNPEEAGKIALEALALSGQRGVLASGWGGLKSSNVPDTVYTISSIPHSWLFPRMGTVVHHGGAGTTAAGLRAGVPSIVVPFMADQPFWGRRVQEMGMGTAPIPRKQLTARRLADAISEAVNSNTMRQKASELGKRIHNEGGVANAVALVEQFVNQSTQVVR